MPLTGSKKQAATQAAPTIRISDLLDQLDSEWQTLKQDSVEVHGADEAGLLAYYHCALRVGIYWVNGDPYRFEFPEGYQQERLAKLCAYLKTLQGADVAEVKAARERTLAGLRACWPAYANLAYPDMPADWPHGVSNWEILPFTWDAIETLWDGDSVVGQGEKARALFLPAFRYRESADFHLAALAVLFLNRQLRWSLTDLYPHPEGVA